MSIEYYRKHREKINQVRREKYKNDPVIRSRRNQERKNWRKNNPEKYKAITARYYQKHKEKFAAAYKKWMKDYPIKVKEYRDRYNAKIRNQIYNHYGRICKCCGEKEIKFLTIDHVNNDGYKYRKKEKGKRQQGWSVYPQIIREGFKDSYQVLCMNCNFGKARNGGICPHKT